MALFLHRLREVCDKDEWAQIESALEPPLDMTLDEDGVPAWYGSDEDAWQMFETAQRSRGIRPPVPAGALGPQEQSGG